MADETPPLDEAQLEAIRRRTEVPIELVGQQDLMKMELFPVLNQAWRDRVVLLDEVDRLRAREAAARIEIAEGINELAQSVLESSYPLDMLPVDHARLALVNIDKRLARARALLAQE